MAQKQRDDRLKQALLLAFVAINLLLVLLIWADGLRAGGEALPGYYRSVPGGRETPPVAVTRFPELDPAGAEESDNTHQGQGHGRGGQRQGTAPTATPLPESTEDLPILPSLDGDDA